MTGLPILITGAALVGLPILLHLIMRQEPKRLPFPAFRFLKQRRQINQRKIRLRHLLLLLLRMALIALICLSLFQPTLLSDGLSLRGNRPIAAVLVIDTSPSMGYVLADRGGLTGNRLARLKLLDESSEGAWTCLDEGRGLAMEILEDLPSASRVAIVDTADRQPFWANSVAEARQRIRDLKKPRANSASVTRALETAYDMLAKVDSENEPGQEPFPRLLAVFSDRTVNSWDASRLPELQSFRDRVPAPSVYHVYTDVGVEKPVNTAITSVQLRPQIVPANQPVLLDITVEATAGAGENILVFSVNGEEQRFAVSPGPDRPVTKQFRKDGLKPGLYQAKVSLVTPDGLPFDNEQFVTFRVREPRNLLVLVDAPASSLLTGALGAPYALADRAYLWKLSLEATRWYAVEVRPVQDVPRIDLTKYAQVTLFEVAEPTKEVWDALDDYVRKSGKVIVVPGGPEMNVERYRTDSAAKVLPRKFSKWYDVPVADPAITWPWRTLSELRPMLKKFRDYQGETDFFEKEPPITRGFWKVDDGSPDRVVVPYNDAADPTQRSPAVLALRTGGERDAVLQFTVPLGAGGSKYHNYGGAGWFYLVLVNEAVRSLTGDAEDATFNYVNGEFVPAHWPAGDAKLAYYLSGPDVSPNDAVLKRTGDAATVYLKADKTVSAGNFGVTAEDGSWRDAFSLNAPAAESNLTRIEAKDIEELFGAGTVYPADKKLTLADMLSGRFTQPIELFPFLMILLLVVLAVENLLANKFYRKRPRAD